MVSKRERNRITIAKRILSAARELILEQESSDFSMPQLAKTADVALVTPYKHFESKAGVLNALLKEIMASNAPERSDETDASENAIDRILDFTAGEVSRLVENEALTRPLISGLVRLNGGTSFNVGAHWVAPWQAEVDVAFKAGMLHGFVRPELIGRSIHTAFFGHALKWVTGEINSRQFAADARYTIALLLLGVASDLGKPILRHRFSEAEQLLSAALADDSDRNIGAAELPLASGG